MLLATADKDDGEGGEDDEGEDAPVGPATMQTMVTSALATALVTHFSHTDISSSFPTMSTLIDNLMDIDPVPVFNTMSNHQPSALPSSSPTDGAAMSVLGSNKQKVHSVIHSAPSSVISAAHSTPSSFNTPLSSDPLSNPSFGHAKHQKALSLATPPSSSNSIRGCSVSSSLRKPSWQI